MQVKAYQDLGALGTAEGPASVFKWTPSSPVPRFLPWLAIVALLLLKSNRTAAAWLIWLPIAFGFGLRLGLQAVFSSAPASAIEMFGDAVIGLTFGWAAVWLLGDSLARQPRALVFLLGTVILAFIGSLTVLSQAGLQAGALNTIPVAILVCFAGAGILLAFTLAGLITRRQCQPARLCVWTALLCLGLAALVAAPFAAVGILAGQDIPVLEAATVILSFGAGAFLILLPYLLLSYASSLYRERLKGMLHLGQSAHPPVVPPGVQPGLPPQISTDSPAGVPTAH